VHAAKHVRAYVRKRFSDQIGRFSLGLLYARFLYIRLGSLTPRGRLRNPERRRCLLSSLAIVIRGRFFGPKISSLLIRRLHIVVLRSLRSSKKSRSRGVTITS